MPNTHINYFGYGPNADRAMMEALTGRTDLIGRPAILMDHRLAIQILAQIPAAPKKILGEAWGPDFKAYVAIPEPGARINGVLWKINEEARRLIRNWELVEEEVGTELAWRKEAYPTSVTFQHGEGSIYGIQTEVLGEGQAFDESEVVDGTNYPLFLMPREIVLREAARIRDQYREELGLIHEGSPSKER